ncbi:hypothetical protein O6H91_22G036500 [Diphasiastrum complanatum]|uniref:Uncharacterized protein n=4 Tax=Diphasiastrum complanatum TaxID=34168 RepID=A0ACC2AEG2_DIPCM|nr:hypothetical protein O6H91_22G036000 [Diphasiastrum complanatum]KAJ7515955.1 hypothetical protein O6H91_22G036000 [Diphasiastrum complanatum]KAJ7515956.1 hypothetical protein O6H91_22G036000 [Diphasiastrum complanatum]KAJ7515965.1 hypothetical protein O6H91_22G036500 [Diphasiastrum complanatum]
MTSWPQYFLDESLEGGYCSEFFGEIPESSMQNSRDSLVQFSGGSSPHASEIGITKVASTSAAMALGASRAAGLIPQLGVVEAFNGVRTSMRPYSKLLTSLAPFTPKNTEMKQKSEYPPTNTFLQNVNELDMPTCMMLSEPQPFGAIFNLPQLPETVPPPQVPLLPFIAKVDPACSVSLISSNPANYFKLQSDDGGTERDSLIELCVPDVLAAVKNEAKPEIVGLQCTNSRTSQNQCISQSSKPSPEISSFEEQFQSTSVADDCSFEAKSPYIDPNHIADAKESEQAGLKKSVQDRSDTLHTPELTETSSERAHNNGVRGETTKKPTTPTGKRKLASDREIEESADCQSEDEFIEVKKVALECGRGRILKRRRTAEVHNLSERRRRDRINERMRALQDLIPNSIKTDKASMLDEAIDYLKELQLQLQMMSIRTGMSIPPMLIPARMQHLQLLQMPRLPHMSMGMGMGMGLGLGKVDMAAATSAQPFISYPASQCESASTISDDYNRLPYSNLMDSYSPLINRQPVNMETYNPYIQYPQQHIRSQFPQQLLHPSRQQQLIQPTTQQNQQPLFHHEGHTNQE